MNQILKLKEVLKRKEKSQVWLATELGTRPHVISRYASGEQMPKPDRLEKIAELLGCDVSELFGAKPTRRNKK